MLTDEQKKERLCAISGCKGKSRSRGWCTKHYARFRKTGDPLKLAPIKLRFCSVKDCNRKHYAKNYCTKHYARFKTHDNPFKVANLMRGVCSVETCEKPHKAKGYCPKHYARFQQTGDPLGMKRIGKDKVFESLRENFNSKFKEGKSNHCWIWNGYIDRDGYGELATWTGKGYKKYRAHRLSYEFYYKEKPGKMLVCHKCDNRACVNPYHLFLGTAQDNATDMINKGRSMFGSSNNRAKITEGDVLDIVEMLKNGRPTKEIGEKYGVHEGTIRRIGQNKSWKNVKREVIC